MTLLNYLLLLQYIVSFIQYYYCGLELYFYKIIVFQLSYIARATVIQKKYETKWNAKYFLAIKVNDVIALIIPEIKIGWHMVGRMAGAT